MQELTSRELFVATGGKLGANPAMRVPYDDFIYEDMDGISEGTVRAITGRNIHSGIVAGGDGSDDIVVDLSSYDSLNYAAVLASQDVSNAFNGFSGADIMGETFILMGEGLGITSTACIAPWAFAEATAMGGATAATAWTGAASGTLLVAGEALQTSEADLDNALDTFLTDNPEAAAIFDFLGGLELTNAYALAAASVDPSDSVFPAWTQGVAITGTHLIDGQQYFFYDSLNFDLNFNNSLMGPSYDTSPVPGADQNGNGIPDNEEGGDKMYA